MARAPAHPDGLASACDLGRRGLLAGLLALPFPVLPKGPDVNIVVHPENPNTFDRVFVQRLYTGVIRGWPDGTPAFVLDLPEDHPLRSVFSQQFLGRSVANVRAVWSQNIFTGKGLPPQVTAAEAEMRRLVATNRNAIGYISTPMLDPTVKTLRL